MVKLVIRGTLPGLNDYITAERSNKYAGAKMKKQCETVVMHHARALGKAGFEKPVHMLYQWYEPNRRRDKDNISSFGRKVIQDALVVRYRRLGERSDEFYIDKKNPRIEVKIWGGRRMKDSPCRGCAKEETCGTPCAKFDVYFRMKWRDIRAMFSVEDAPVASPTRGQNQNAIPSI